MTYYGGKELAAAFRTVRDNTIKMAEEIPEEKLSFSATPDTKTIGQTLTHIAVSSGFQHHVHSMHITDMRTLNFPELFQKFQAVPALALGSQGHYWISGRCEPASHIMKGMAFPGPGAAPEERDEILAGEDLTHRCGLLRREGRRRRI